MLSMPMSRTSTGYGAATSAVTGTLQVELSCWGASAGSGHRRGIVMVMMMMMVIAMAVLQTRMLVAMHMTIANASASQSLAGGTGPRM